jgi:hypothetical protein
MTPQNVALILICLFLAPTILTTLLFVDDSAFTFVVAAMRQLFQRYLAEQWGVPSTLGRWDHVWTHMKVELSAEQRLFLPQLPLPSTSRKVIRRRAVDFTLSDSPGSTRSPFSFTSLSLFTRTPNSGQLQPLVFTEESTWDYAFSMKDISLAFMTTAQRDLETALLAAAEERKVREKKERIEAKKKFKMGGKVNRSLWSIGH